MPSARRRLFAPRLAFAVPSLSKSISTAGGTLRAELLDVGFCMVRHDVWYRTKKALAIQEKPEALGRCFDLFQRFSRTHRE